MMQPNVLGTSRRSVSWIPLVLLLAVVCGGTAPSALLARPTAPTPVERPIALSVTSLMERMHLSGHDVDDEIATRCMETLFKTLDPLKTYFYQSDLEEFAPQREDLDEMVKRGDVRFAHQVFKRFLTRVEERIDLALRLVDAEHDFTLDEQIVNEPDNRKYATTPAEAEEIWRRRVKFDLLKELADGEQLDEARQKLHRRYKSILKRWDQTDNDELLELFLTSMTTSFDPHSTYMSPGTLDDFKIHMRLKLDGIGASLRQMDGYTEVMQVIAGGAADQDGRLKEGDQIVGVGQGTDGPIEDVVDIKLKDVVKLIRGERGTTVRLEVRPVDNPTKREIYTMVRQEIKLTESEARGTVIPWGTKPNGQPYQLGIIVLPSFYLDMDAAQRGDPNYTSSTADVRRLLTDFNRQQVDAVLVDLRQNGGGSLSEAVSLTGLFIDQGPVVQVKDPNGSTTPMFDPEPGMVWSGPLVVLTNKYSASASEIFAGAIQDYNRGLVIGDQTTHGKGTVQQLYDLGRALFRVNINKNLGALKLTIQQFYRPDGDSTQNHGVASDIVLPSLISHLAMSESDLDYAVAFDRIAPLRHDEYQMVHPGLTRQLRALSQQRVNTSEDFARTQKRIQLFEERKERGTVTLNLEQFLADREKLDTTEEEQKAFEAVNDNDRPLFDTENHYNQETLAVLVDYLELLKDQRVAIAQ